MGGNADRPGVREHTWGGTARIEGARAAELREKQEDTQIEDI
jgi:hypothetical protein